MMRAWSWSGSRKLSSRARGQPLSLALGTVCPSRGRGGGLRAKETAKLNARLAEETDNSMLRGALPASSARERSAMDGSVQMTLRSGRALGSGKSQGLAALAARRKARLPVHREEVEVEEPRRAPRKRGETGADDVLSPSESPASRSVGLTGEAAWKGTALNAAGRRAQRDRQPDAAAYPLPEADAPLESPGGGSPCQPPVVPVPLALPLQRSGVSDLAAALAL